MDSFLVLPDDAQPGSLTSVFRIALTAFSGDALKDAWQRGHDVAVASLIIQDKGTFQERVHQALKDGISDALALAPEADREGLEKASHRHHAAAIRQFRASMPSKGQQLRELVTGDK